MVFVLVQTHVRYVDTVFIDVTFPERNRKGENVVAYECGILQRSGKKTPAESERLRASDGSSIRSAFTTVAVFSYLKAAPLLCS